VTKLIRNSALFALLLLLYKPCSAQLIMESAAGVGDPDSICTTVTLWLKGEDLGESCFGTLTTWTDSGDHSNDFDQAISTWKPTLITGAASGFCASDYDGGNDFLTSSSSMTTTAQPFVFAYVVDKDTGTGAGLVAEMSNSSSGSTANEAVEYDAGTTLTGSNDDISENEWEIHTVLFDGSNSEFWIDGSSVDTGNAGTGNISGTGYIGAGASFGTEWNGAIQEVVICSGSGTDEDTAADLDAYLNDLYSVY